MKKGLYIHFDETGDPRKSGILNKINGQRAALHNAGFPTDVISFRSRKELSHNNQVVLRLPSRQLFFRYFIYRKILSICKENHFGFIYIRYAKSDRFLNHFLKRVKSLDPRIFIEFPTYPYDDEMNPKNRIESYINNQDRKFRQQLHLHVDYAVSTVVISGDIFDMPTFRIDNGIDLSKIRLIPHQPVQNEIRIIGVANLNRWHAWDRVIKGLSNYYKDGNIETRVTFKIIGTGPSFKNLVRLHHDLGMEEVVTFAGPKTGEELDREFLTADLAMGTLGLHRIGLDSTSVLKLREYTARGLPTVIGYREPVISEKEPFIHRVPPDESDVDIANMVAFYRDMKPSRKEIRLYAEQHFSWTSVLEPVFEKLRE